jgi:hypothetical protein
MAAYALRITRITTSAKLTSTALALVLATSPGMAWADSVISTGNYTQSVFITDNTTVEPGSTFTTTNNDGYGIAALGNGSAYFMPGTSRIITSGFSAYGLLARNSATVSGTGRLTISTTGDFAYGVYAADQSSITLGGATITTTGGYRQEETGAFATYGVAASSSASIVLANSSIDVYGPVARGVLVASGSVFLSGTEITVHSTDVVYINGNAFAAAGIVNYGGGKVSAVDSTIKTSGDYSFGVQTSKGGETTLIHSSILTSGVGAYGVIAYGPATAILGTVDIQTSGAQAIGIYAYGQDSQIQIAAHSSITVSGDSSIGAYASSGSSINLMETEIKASGSRSSGATVSGADTILGGTSALIQNSGDGGYGATARTGGSLNLAKSTIQTTGSSHGLLVTSGAQAKLRYVQVTTSGTGANGIQITAGGSLDMLGGSASVSGPNAIGAYATGAGSNLNIHAASVNADDDAALGGLCRSGCTGNAGVQFCYCFE